LPKRSQTSWVKLPDIHPTKLIFVEDKLPYELFALTISVVPVLNM
jgi:hypothetical protein